MEHKLDIRVYYESTDAGGVVYHANYLNFAERGRTEFLRHIGHENSGLTKEFGTIFVVRHIEIDYLKPAVLDDLLSVHTSVATIKNSSFVMNQKVYKQNTPDNKPELLSDMKVTLVCVDANTIKPIRLPAVVRDEFEKYKTG